MAGLIDKKILVLFLILIVTPIWVQTGCAKAPAPVPAEPVQPAAVQPEPSPPEAPPPPVIPAAARFWTPLILDLARDGLDGERVASLFARPDVVFTPDPMRRKLEELFRLNFKSDLTTRIQAGLTELGYTPGVIDGKAGDNTRRAVKAFQRRHGLRVDGEPSAMVLEKIKAYLALPAEKRPAPVRTLDSEAWKKQVYQSYLTRQGLAEAEAFYLKHRPELAAMTARYGVPAEYAVGILRVETNFGAFTGREKAFNVLAGMAVCRDFAYIEPYLGTMTADPSHRSFLIQTARDRGEWAYEELKALLIYARRLGRDPLQIPGSIYGAVGYCQFMPTNIIKYGQDGDGDGRVDLFNMADAIFSIGAYFQGHGWQGSMNDEQKRREVVFLYNRSTRYVNTVMAVARHLKPN